MKILASLIVVLLSTHAFAADSCATHPDETFSKIISTQKVDIADLSSVEADLKTIGAKVDGSLSASEKVELGKMAHRDWLAVELHIGAARLALADIKGMKGDSAFGAYVNLTTSAFSYYAEIFKLTEKYLVGQASSNDIKMVVVKLQKNAVSLRSQGQSVTEGLKALESGVLGKIANAHSEASRIERCKLARKMFVK